MSFMTPPKAVKRSRSEDSNLDRIAAENIDVPPETIDVDEEENNALPFPGDDIRTISPSANHIPAPAVSPSIEERVDKTLTPPIDKPKQQRQTKLFFGIRTDESDKSLQEKEAQLLERDSTIDDLTRKCASLENELSLERSARINFERMKVELEDKVRGYQAILTEVMKEAARTQRRESRRAEHNMHFDLGQILVCQNAIGPKELWVEGNRKRELDVEISELSAKIVAIESSKKNMRQRKRITDNEDSTGHDPSLDLEEQLQMQQHTLDALKVAKAEAELKVTQLQAEKTAFLKEIRRINDEDSSEFANVQSLNNGRYVLLSLLGKGGFSEVWKAFDVQTPQYVACKIHRINRDWSHATREHYLKHAKRELEIMHKLDHPRLTKLFDIFDQDITTFVSVQELSEGTDLDTYLKRYGRMKETDARAIMLQLVSALRHLAEQESPIIHYDLKPANIIFHSAFPSCLDIKVTDFGLSKIIKQSGNSDDPTIELTSQGTGTYWYLPPECFETGVSPPKISSKVDIWAVGIIFYQLLYGKRPFAEGESQRRIWQDKLILNTARNVVFPAEPKIGDGAKEVIQLCLKYNVSERPDVIALSKLPYFSKAKRGGGSSGGTSKMLPPAPPGTVILEGNPSSPVQGGTVVPKSTADLP